MVMTSMMMFTVLVIGFSVLKVARMKRNHRKGHDANLTELRNANT